jgi:16S rRNA (cytidine1402-2'-O)-methyltransferase
VPTLAERSSCQWYNNRLFEAPPVFGDDPGRQLSGSLFVIATPIGNLEDITLRALRVLREADLVAAEDTRRTAKLLSHHGIATPTTSFHEHNASSRIPSLLRRIGGGSRVALVSDAGTPGIADPGVRLVQACGARGLPVVVVPGPSAPLAAAVVSGFPLDPLTIHGFAPARASDRRRFLDGLRSIPHTLTFFEAPHRLRPTLTDVSTVLGERQMVVAREMTKLHEQVVHGTARELLEVLVEVRGECTCVIGPAETSVKPSIMPDDQAVAAEFWRTAETGAEGRRAALGAVARRLGLRPREVYAAVERAKNGAKDPLRSRPEDRAGEGSRAGKHEEGRGRDSE